MNRLAAISIALALATEIEAASETTWNRPDCRLEVGFPLLYRLERGDYTVLDAASRDGQIKEYSTVDDLALAALLAETVSGVTVQCGQRHRHLPAIGLSDLDFLA